jgi:hypothetical protein
MPQLQELAEGRRTGDPDQLVDVTLSEVAWLPAIARLTDRLERLAVSILYRRAIPRDETRTLTLTVRYWDRLTVASRGTPWVLMAVTSYRPEAASLPPGYRPATPVSWPW